MSFRFVAVGTSLGGFQALRIVLGALPKDFPLPIAVVQHRRYDDTEPFASLLNGYTDLSIVEVEDKDVIEPERVYLCPSNYHLLVDRDHFALSTDAPVLHARPSIDMFFESAADSFGEGLVGLLLTGMSKDGTAGLRRIKDRGGYAIVQDPSRAEGHIMPESAISCIDVDKILPLEEIAPFLMELCIGQRTEA
jgi:two-component system chemotaxis response regulator CheB